MEQAWNKNGTRMEQEWPRTARKQVNKNGTRMEQIWRKNGTRMEQAWIGMESELEQKWNKNEKSWLNRLWQMFLTIRMY